MFQLGTYICTGFIHVNRDSICDVTMVQEYNRQVVFTQDHMETRLLVLLTVVPTSKDSESSARGATAKMFNKYLIEYIIYILCCIYNYVYSLYFI